MLKGFENQILALAWVLPSVNVVAFLIILLLGKRFIKKGAELSIFIGLGGLLYSLISVGIWIVHSPVDSLHPISKTLFSITFGQFHWKMGISVDGLSLMMLFLITTISLLVQIYSTGYMRSDLNYTWYFAILNLFVGAMAFLVLSNSLLEVLICWELVGLCSFLLIGHWWSEEKNVSSALKAFLITKTADIFFIIAIAIAFFANKFSFSISALNYLSLHGLSHTLIVVIAISLLIAVIGKSAQFPLYSWLPDAMVGPTPVSALIHAATMVVAGVYLIARLYPVFWQAFNIHTIGFIRLGGINLLAIIGAVTMLIAALSAFVQYDLKKVLAFSTISQIGFMLMALGVGAWSGAIFQLFTHGFIKSLLFLTAGAIGESAGGFDMRTMGGLGKKMKFSFFSFVIGAASLSGVFPLSGFWSKDQVLAAAGANGYNSFLIIGLIGSFLTAAYMTRAIYLTFFGSYKGRGEPKEHLWIMKFPIGVLSLASIGIGWTLLLHPGFSSWTFINSNRTIISHIPSGSLSISFVSSFVVIISIVLVVVLLSTSNSLFNSDKSFLNVTFSVLRSNLGLDFILVKIIGGLFSNKLPQGVLWIEDKVIQFPGRTLSLAASYCGKSLQRFQNGKIQRYATAMIVGVILLGIIAAII